MIACKICGRTPTEPGTVLKRTNTSNAKVPEFICRAGTGCRQKVEIAKELFRAK